MVLSYLRKVAKSMADVLNNIAKNNEKSVGISGDS